VHLGIAVLRGGHQGIQSGIVQLYHVGSYIRNHEEVRKRGEAREEARMAIKLNARNVTGRRRLRLNWTETDGTQSERPSLDCWNGTLDVAKMTNG
jgi:hypothetical protein